MNWKSFDDDDNKNNKPWYEDVDTDSSDSAVDFNQRRSSDGSTAIWYDEAPIKTFQRQISSSCHELEFETR